jgi:hypothetical protein
MFVDSFPVVHTDDLVVIGEAMHRINLSKIDHESVQKRNEAYTQRLVAAESERNEKGLHRGDVSRIA